MCDSSNDLRLLHHFIITIGQYSMPERQSHNAFSRYFTNERVMMMD